MFWFKSPCYDLHTGNTLLPGDLFSFDQQQLFESLISKGYLEEAMQDGKILRQPVDTNYLSQKEITENLFSTDSTQHKCSHFYFNKIDNEIHLRIVTECNGPAWPTAFIFGISLKELSRSIVYPPFKNALRLWGAILKI